MKTSSAKAKGRRAALEAKTAILKRFGNVLQDDDILVTSSGATGEDLRLSPAARGLLPLTFEVKNQEKINIWEAIAQAAQHSRLNGQKPAVLFRRNRSELMITLKLSDFLELV
jgi:hypothetical protein